MLIESSFNLLTELFFFFSSEELLNNFSQTQDSWKHCLFFMANTQNEYVMMFCLTVLEVSQLKMPSSQQLKGRPTPQKTSWTLFSVFNEDSFRSLDCKVFSFGQSELQQMVGTLKSRALA